MGLDLDDERVFTAVAQAVGEVCDVEPESLNRETIVGELGIDSMDAADILVQVQSALSVKIDFRHVAADWSNLTLGDLALDLAKHTVPKP
jgi:acyl carrier protein